MPTTIEDRLVVGDVSVMADLYRQHGQFIHTISQKLVGAAADRLTQQVFAEAWRDRLDFNPSLGTVRNWLIRRARSRVSKPSAEADVAVDRLVVADSLARMDDLRRRVVLGGYDASDVEELALSLDQPLASVRGHLRRGRDVLKTDLADSRSDGSDASLPTIMADGLPELELVTPPEVVWQAIAAELGLDPGAVTRDSFKQSHPVSDQLATADHDPDDADEPDADEPDGDGPGAASPEDHLPADAGVAEPSTVPAVPADSGGSDSIDHLRGPAEAASLDRHRWVGPAVVAVALVLLAVLILTAF